VSLVHCWRAHPCFENPKVHYRQPKKCWRHAL
jgi:hypothetical protein